MTNELNRLVIMHDKRAVTSSLQVAETFGKNHQHVLEAIDNLTVENSTVKEMFAEGAYKNSRGRDYRLIYMTRDGFAILAMGFTGAKALEFKLKYIAAFNAMEQTLKKVPIKKLDPDLQTELAISRTKTAKANALYRIAMATTSESSKQALLADAAKAVTGEMRIPVMKQAEYSAAQVAAKLGLSSAKRVGMIAKALGLQAAQPGQNEFGRWSSSKSQHSDKEVPQWLYTDKGLAAIGSEAKVRGLA